MYFGCTHGHFHHCFRHAKEVDLLGDVKGGKCTGWVHMGKPTQSVSKEGSAWEPSVSTYCMLAPGFVLFLSFKHENHRLRETRTVPVLGEEICTQTYLVYKFLQVP